ncbi:MAG: DNA translocase FtsK [Cytophagaceae bacterium]|jgi:S-DNA-T family DNA segregation ATPase FtsK/SpoIIIE|nr:DNA translocase FtsK [Cytophagaceae bacterium]
MAENTYKKTNVPKEKKNKPKGKKEAKAEIEEPSRPSFEWKFASDKRFILVAGISLIVVSLYLFLAFFSYFFSGAEDQSVVEAFFDSTLREAGKEAQNWMGLSGAVLAHFFVFRWFGMAALLFAPPIFVYGVRLAFGAYLTDLKSLIKVNFFFLLWISFTLGYFVYLLDSQSGATFLCGGIGFELAALSDELIGIATPLLILLSGLIFGVYYFNITTFLNPADEIKEMNYSHEVEEENVEISEEEELIQVKDAEDSEQEPNQLEEVSDVQEDDEDDPTRQWEVKLLDENKKAKDKQKVTPDLELTIENQEDIPPFDTTVHQTPLVTPDITADSADPLVVVDDQFVAIKEEDKTKDLDQAVLENYDPTLDLPSYQYPTLDLLKEYDGARAQVTKEELEANKDRIVDTLKNYSIGIASIKATIGPTVTLYEIVPEAGVRISKIKSLEDDIALSLSALGIRIIAPMPGKGTIGIEVPNKNKEMVSIRSVLSTEKFQLSDRELPVAFGKTISNEIFIIDLAKMPHLLMAGATGQGKSVGLNILLTSLLYKKHPSQLKFVLVDPKKVELSVYNTIERHFLAKLPNSEEAIITDTKKVIHTLNSLCIEMDNRYDLLKEAGCRNLKEYNTKFVERRLNPTMGHRFLPYIVLVIDELADLMMTAGKEVETPIARLAQLARAIGIHLVVATQRPSVNVITGIIKANFPARLSFKVTSKVDSRTILDASGAEQLIGQGDMLFSQGSDVIRLQCAFVDTPEVERVAEFIGAQRAYPTAYQLPEFSEEDMEEGKNEDFDFADRDKLFDEAARLIVSTQQGSTSLIQRRMKLGYNRAGRLIDQLESAGIVGPFEGSKAREVLIKDLASLEMLLNELNTRG